MIMITLARVMILTLVVVIIKMVTIKGQAPDKVLLFSCQGWDAMDNTRAP